MRTSDTGNRGSGPEVRGLPPEMIAFRIVHFDFKLSIGCRPEATIEQLVEFLVEKELLPGGKPGETLEVTDTNRNVLPTNMKLGDANKITGVLNVSWFYYCRC